MNSKAINTQTAEAILLKRVIFVTVTVGENQKIGHTIVPY